MKFYGQNGLTALLVIAAFLAGFAAHDIGSGNNTVNASEHIPNLPAEMFVKGTLLRIYTSAGVSIGQVVDAYDTWIKIKEENERYAYWIDTRVVEARYVVVPVENAPDKTQ